MKSIQILALTLFLTMTLIGAALGGENDRAEQLRELHLQWLGGRSVLEQLTDISTAGELQTSGLTGTLSVRQHKDGYQRVDYDLQVAKGTEIVTPQGGWELNFSGQLEAMAPTKLEGKEQGFRYSFNEHLLTDPMEYIGEEERGDKLWAVLRINDPNGTLLDLFIDPADGSMIWARKTTSAAVGWDQLEDWRIVNGLRLAFSQVTTQEGVPAESRITWETITINSGLTPEDFSTAGLGREVVSSAAPVSSEWRDFTLFNDSYIYLPCEVNGATTELVLDSGAGITVIDSAFAEEIGLAGEREIVAKGVSGTQSAWLASGVNITIGDLKLNDLTVAIIDMSYVATRVGRSMPVVMGKEIFHNMIVDVDYPQRRLAFHDPGSFRYEEQGHSLDLYPTESGKRLVEASLNGLPPVRFQLDTGSGGSADIFANYLEEQDLLTGCERISTSYGGGVGGGQVSRLAVMDSFDFAGFVLENIPMRFPPGEGAGSYADSRYAGNLGVQIFSRFRMIFDFPHDRLHVEAGPDWATRPFRRNHLGLVFDWIRGKLRVIHVAIGSPGERAGFGVGDIVRKLNGKRVTEEHWLAEYRQLRNREIGDLFYIRLENGRRRPVMPDEYY
ncbi:MAG: hypothetical protein GY835_10700 [bacterium]|nr:hypothetical protein [bacterium]